jgi:membrane fusion protein, multidrug efflux system
MSGRRRTGRIAVAGLGLAAAGAAVAAATGFGFGLTGGGESGAGTGLPPATATVTRQTLVDTKTETGELGYGDQTSLAARLAGTLTGLPAIGSTVARGQALYRVDNGPVVLLYGSLPAYRGLAIGAEGADVKLFERNLWALGHRGFTVDTRYTGATADAVRAWQEDLGLAETGAVELGRVAYAGGAVRVDTHEAAIGGALPPGAAVLTYTGPDRIVTVDLDADDGRLATRGSAVGLTLPGGRTVGGKVARSTTVVEAGDGDGPDGSQPVTLIRVSVTVDDPKAFDGLDQASVDVAFTASRRENVLTVPVAALLALAEGGYGVEVVDGGGSRIVAVRTGLFARGRVEVEGDGLTEGTTVGVPA